MSHRDPRSVNTSNSTTLCPPCRTMGLRARRQRAPLLDKPTMAPDRLLQRDDSPPGRSATQFRTLHRASPLSTQTGNPVLCQLLIWGVACRFGSGQRAAYHFLQPQHLSLTRHQVPLYTSLKILHTGALSVVSGLNAGHLLGSLPGAFCPDSPPVGVGEWNTDPPDTGPPLAGVQRTDRVAGIPPAAVSARSIRGWPNSR